MCDKNLKEENQVEVEIQISKNLLESLCAKEYSEVCVNLARLIKYFVDTTECSEDKLINGITLPVNEISLDRACGLMGGWMSRFLSTSIYKDRVRLLRDMVAVSGFDFKKVYVSLHEKHGDDIPFEEIETEIRNVISKFVGAVNESKVKL